MSRWLPAVAFVLPLAFSSATMAATWTFGGTATTLPILTKTVPGEATLTVVARGFTPAPSTLTNLSQLTTTRTIDRISDSIGVVGGANTQLDTNSPTAREAFLISSDKLLKLTGVKLSVIDSNDTLRIYGVGPGGALTSLGFGDRVYTGLGGAASVVNTGTITAGQSGTSTLTFNSPLAAYSQYVFTTRAGGDVVFGGDTGQGYRLNSISAMAVPEPASWALLIAGFGLVGTAMRRRPSAVAG